MVVFLFQNKISLYIVISFLKTIFLLDSRTTKLLYLSFLFDNILIFLCFCVYMGKQKIKKMKKKKKFFISLYDFAEVFKQPGIIIVCVVSLFIFINLVYFKFFPTYKTDLLLYASVLLFVYISNVFLFYVSFSSYLYYRTRGIRYSYRIIKYVLLSCLFYLIAIIIIVFVYFYTK